MSDLFNQRRRQRDAVERAERDMENADKRMRATTRRDAPPLVPTREQLAANPQQAITVNVEWVGAAMANARSEGWQACLAVFKPLLDHANNHPDGWREAFNESVTDPALRKILTDALDTL